MKKKKYYFTLMEIMIVISLITIITAAVGYSMKGSLERGRIFRTDRAIEQIKDILYMEMAANSRTLDDVVNNPEAVIRASQLAKEPEKLLTDGWGEKILVEKDKNELKVHSERLDGINAEKAKEKEKDIYAN